MLYEGSHPIFDTSRLRTYPLLGRSNKVTIDQLIRPEQVDPEKYQLPAPTIRTIRTIAQAVVEARNKQKSVILFTGAHLIKNGLGPLVVDLIHRGLVTLLAANAAAAIHDFELALIGQTSENVPDALGKGQFGMAYEFAYINKALVLGDQQNLGFGESLGATICDEHFRRQVLTGVAAPDGPAEFVYPQISVLAACYKTHTPCTIHAGIGTDVTDQHPSFDGRAKGGCSARDFLIFAQHVTNLAGGVVLNIGSAVTGPEVLLKAVSMAANIGKPPMHLLTADLDLRPYRPDDTTDESSFGYYFRDQKSVVNRIPAAFDGKGYYVCGDQKQTFPLLYHYLVTVSSQSPKQ